MCKGFDFWRKFLTWFCGFLLTYENHYIIMCGWKIFCLWNICLIYEIVYFSWSPVGPVGSDWAALICMTITSFTALSLAMPHPGWTLSRAFYGWNHFWKFSFYSVVFIDSLPHSLPYYLGAGNYMKSTIIWIRLLISLVWTLLQTFRIM